MKVFLFSLSVLLTAAFCAQVPVKAEKKPHGIENYPIVPTHYSMALSINPDQTTYEGQLDFHFRCIQETDHIEMHMGEKMCVDPGRVYLFGPEKQLLGLDKMTRDVTCPDVVKIALRPGEQLRPIDPDDSDKVDYVLRVSFQTTFEMQTGMGHVRLWDRRGGWQINTLLEPEFARTAFPCIDIPALKAPLSLQLIIPHRLKGYSNMMSIKTEQLTGDLKRITFQKSPPMSTYLMSWAVGDFDIQQDESFTLTTLSAITVPTAIPQCQYVMEIARKSLEFLTNKLFLHAYGLSKLDLISCPGGLGGFAIENWGLVLIESTLMHCRDAEEDPKDGSSVRMKQMTAYVVAHELAHQWFGDEVTMAGWPEVWLNEGFASWAGWEVAEEIRPKWNVWAEGYLVQIHGALWFDGHSDHPVIRLESLAKSPSSPSSLPLAIDSSGSSSTLSLGIQMKEIRKCQKCLKDLHPPGDPLHYFDSVTYGKASAIIRMISHVFGREGLSAGLRLFITRHCHSTATSDNLFAAIEEANNGERLKGWLGRLIKPWLTQPRFPLIRVIERENKWVLKMSVYRRAWHLGQGDDKIDDCFFPIPIGPLLGNESTEWWTQEKEFVIAPQQIINRNVSIYCRVLYPSSFYKNLTNSQFYELNAIERVALVADAFALSMGGHLSIKYAMRLLSFVHEAEEHALWFLADEILSRMASIWRLPSQGYNHLHRFITLLISKQLARLGVNESSQENDQDRLIRPIVLKWAGILNDKKILEACSEQYNKWLSGDGLVAYGGKILGGSWWDLSYGFLGIDSRPGILANAMKASGGLKDAAVLMRAKDDVTGLEHQLALLHGLVNINSPFIRDQILGMATGSGASHILETLAMYPQNYQAVLDHTINNLPKYVAESKGRLARYLISVLRPIGIRIGNREEYGRLKAALDKYVPKSYIQEAKAILSMASDNLDWSNTDISLDCIAGYSTGVLKMGL